jgi:hypothetical protein
MWGSVMDEMTSTWKFWSEESVNHAIEEEMQPDFFVLYDAGGWRYTSMTRRRSRNKVFEEEIAGC